MGGLKSPVKRAYLLADARKRRSPAQKRRRAGPGGAGAGQGAPPVRHRHRAGDSRATSATDPARLLSTDVSVDTLRAFDGKLQGGLGFGAGKARDAYVLGWDQASDSVRWPVRLRQPATFEVAIAYDAEAGSAGGTFAVKVGDKTLSGHGRQEHPGPGASLGRVSLPAGSFEIAVEGTSIKGGELFKLRALTLTPVGDAIAQRL